MKTSGAVRARGFLIATLLAISAVSCGSEPTPAEVIAACRADTSAQCCGDDDCDPASACQFSFVCAQGSNHKVTCDPPTGDRQCHARCDALPCAAGQTCQSVTIVDGSDTGRNVSICIGKPSP